jgi:hypothetical protein
MQKRGIASSRYANRAGSRFKFLPPPVGQSPKGDTPIDVVLRFVADTKLANLRVQTLPRRYLNALSFIPLSPGRKRTDFRCFLHWSYFIDSVISLGSEARQCRHKSLLSARQDRSVM